MPVPMPTGDLFSFDQNSKVFSWKKLSFLLCQAGCVADKNRLGQDILGI